MEYKKILRDLKSVDNLKTADIDAYNRKLIKEKADVSGLREHILREQILHRTYFQVSLGQLDTVAEQFGFIEKNGELLRDWWHVDQLTQFIKKPVDFDFAFAKAKLYINSDLTFMRRWGYVLFLTGLQKDARHTEDILSLMKDDDEYYVQMAQAWLIADLAVYNAAEVKKFAETTRLRYNIMGKAVQKMCDSLRISDEDKTYMRSLRTKLRGNRK